MFGLMTLPSVTRMYCKKGRGEKCVRVKRDHEKLLRETTSFLWGELCRVNPSLSCTWKECVKIVFFTKEHEKPYRQKIVPFLATFQISADIF